MIERRVHARRALTAALATGVFIASLLTVVPASAATAEDGGVSPSDPTPPGRIEVSGVLQVVPSEPKAAVVHAGESLDDVDVEMHGGAVTLFSDDGTAVELWGDAVEGAVSGTRFEGVVSVPAPVARLVQRKVLNDGLELDASQTGELVLDTASTSAAPLGVVTASLTPPVAAAATPRQHLVDVLYLYPAGHPDPAATDQEIRDAVGRLSAYWSTQSGGQITSVAVGKTPIIRGVTIDVCDAQATWNYGATQMGIQQSSYWSGTSARHLVVLVPGAVCAEGNGLGTIGGNIHTGGLIWASIDEPVPSEWNQVLFHEFGHNLGLGHSNQRACFDSNGDPIATEDSQFNTGQWRPNAPCADYEYFDLYDVMGMGFKVLGDADEILLSNSTKVTSLNVTHKARLDALPRGSATGLVPVNASNGLQQTFTINAAGATSGSRGLEITDPLGAERVYVEYRSGTGQDDQSLYKGWQSVMGDSEFAPGVRIMRKFDCTNCADLYSTAISRYDGTLQVMYRTAGQSFSSYTRRAATGSIPGVRVEVLSTTSTTATIRVTLNDGLLSFPSTPAPTITTQEGGAAHFGKTLVANTGTWETVNGTANAGITFRYQWYRGATAIPGATISRYMVDGYDVGQPITVRVTASKTNYRTVTTTSAAVSPTGPTVTRIASTSRYGTAVEVSKAAFPTTAPIVYLATGTNYPDALAAAPAAATNGGPLLLIPPRGDVPQVVIDRILQLDPDRIVVVGGLSAIPEASVEQIRAAVPSGTQIDRFAGGNRFETGRMLVEDAFGDRSDIGDVYIATGRNYPDALSASAVAGGRDQPVVLVSGGSAALDANTLALLADLDPDRTIIVGGPNAVSTGIENQLKRLYPTVRLQGINRYQTSATINERSFGTGTPAPAHYYATGVGFADALSGAVLAAVKGAPLYVVTPACVPAYTTAQAGAKNTTSVTLIGGESALNSKVAALGRC